MPQSTSMTDALNTIKDETNGDDITVGDITNALQNRGFGALLIAPALITILPTGMIPGIPAICGFLIFLIAVQIVIGKDRPWLPHKFKQISFSRDRYNEAIEKAKPYTQKIDDFFHPRFEFLTQDTAQRVIALFCVFLSIAMIVIGFIPFAPALFAAAILLFGLGLSVHDGLLTAFGFVLVGTSIITLPFLF